MILRWRGADSLIPPGAVRPPRPGSTQAGFSHIRERPLPGSFQHSWPARQLLANAAKAVSRVAAYSLFLWTACNVRGRLIWKRLGNVPPWTESMGLSLKASARRGFLLFTPPALCKKRPADSKLWAGLQDARDSWSIRHRLPSVSPAKLGLAPGHPSPDDCHQTAASRSPDQWRDSNVMTMSVVSGSWSSRPVESSSLQLARFTTLPDWAAAPAVASAGSTILSPLRSRKNVCSPNKSLSCGITGWSSGMARASNWPKVRSSCAELSFIARSFRSALRRCAARYRALRGLPPQPTSGGQMRTSVIPRGLGKLFSRIVKWTTETAAQRARNGMAWHAQ